MIGEAHGGNRTRAGFTLIELLLVVVILAAGLTLAVVKLDGLLPRTRLQATARRIGRIATSLRTQAISLGERVYLDYDVPGGRIRARREARDAGDDRSSDPNDPALEIYAWYVLPDGVKIHDVALSATQAVSADVISVPFEPSGTTVHHMVHLELEGGQHRFTIEVTAVLGRVRLLDDWQDFEAVTDDDFRT